MRWPNLPWALMLGSILMLGPGLAKQTGQMAVVGYLPDYRWYIDVEAAANHLTDLILFSAAPQPDGSLVSYIDAANMKRGRLAADAVPTHGVRLILAIGGAGRSAHFPGVLASPVARSKFIKEVLKAARTHELEGLDFDIETQMKPVDWENLAVVCETIHKKRKTLQLSMSLHPGVNIPKHLIQVIDRVHLMTYDMRAGQHSSLEDTQRAAQFLLQTGISPEKVILGIPAYGRHKATAMDVQSYAEMIDGLKKSNSISEESSGGFMFNTPQMVKQKVDWARSKKLGGLMVWEIGQDKIGHPESLLATISGLILPSATAQNSEL